MRAFMPPHFPVTLGSEFSGIVAEIPDQHSNFKVGDQVYGRTQQAYAEYVVVDSANANAKIIAEFLDYVQAASLPSGSQVSESQPFKSPRALVRM